MVSWPPYQRENIPLFFIVLCPSLQSCLTFHGPFLHTIRYEPIISHPINPSHTRSYYPIDPLPRSPFRTSSVADAYRFLPPPFKNGLRAFRDHRSSGERQALFHRDPKSFLDELCATSPQRVNRLLLVLSPRTQSPTPRPGRPLCFPFSFPSPFHSFV